MARLAERDGLDKNRVYDLGLWVLAASLIGSKLLMVVTEWGYYRGDWARSSLWTFFRSGGVFYGGFIGAVIASVIVMRRYHLPWWRTADAFAPGIAIGQAIGRLGCFSAGCCWGKPTTADGESTFPSRATTLRVYRRSSNIWIRFERCLVEQARQPHFATPSASDATLRSGGDGSDFPVSVGDSPAAEVRWPGNSVLRRVVFGRAVCDRVLAR